MNECEEAANGGCESQCCNTVGSFYCRCPEGSRLKDDGKACEGTGSQSVGPLAAGGFSGLLSWTHGAWGCCHGPGNGSACPNWNFNFLLGLKNDVHLKRHSRKAVVCFWFLNKARGVGGGGLYLTTIIKLQSLQHGCKDLLRNNIYGFE